MKCNTKPVAVFLLLLCAVELSDIESAHARGGGPNFTDSPGYQRRLVESRSQLGTTQPYTTPPSAYPGKKWKKRGKRK